MSIDAAIMIALLVLVAIDGTRFAMQLSGRLK
jgi:hypothetical protein